MQGLAGLLRAAALPAKENPVLCDSFTQIYILFTIGFRIGPPQVTLNLLPPDSTVCDFWCTMAIMQEKQENFLFERVILSVLKCHLYTLYPVFVLTALFPSFDKRK